MPEAEVYDRIINFPFLKEQKRADLTMDFTMTGNKNIQNNVSKITDGEIERHMKSYVELKAHLLRKQMSEF